MNLIILVLKTRIHNKFCDVCWWFKYRLMPKYRYHVVKLDAKPGYMDTDIRLELAMIAVLKEHVDYCLGGRKGLVKSIEGWEAYATKWKRKRKENWVGQRQWEIDVGKTSAEHFAQVLELYDYFTKEYVSNKWISSDAIQDDSCAKDSVMFKKLIDIHNCLWT
jgi:hypothetical protein